jgi:hypothetical protein
MSDLAAYDAWVNAVPDAHIRQWKSQPGNYQLMTKQGVCGAVVELGGARAGESES